MRTINRKSKTLLKILAISPVYKKQGTVKAKPVYEKETIFTVLEEGKKETENRAKKGDWVITNPGGEQYVISGDEFESRYEPTGIEGIYRARGYCRAILNPFGEEIKIMAPWGFPQRGDKNCMIAVVCDVKGNLLKKEFYRSLRPIRSSVPASTRPVALPSFPGKVELISPQA